MATKKKSKKQSAKKPSRAPQKKTGKKPAAKSAAKKGSAAKKRLVAKPSQAKKSPKHASTRAQISTRGKREVTGSVDFEPTGLGPRSGGQAGDLQGLSNVAGADSESVDELVEEGNAFEAGIIKGVQDVPDADEEEVTTHEVPEDDVPSEYDEE
jgi:hypothetical protein